ncbi:MAG: hypothetical protein LBG92_08570 [Prevotellaceae bacterium]|jgi:tetratricopeptide (TPR) repeat protein|nr:hypothetical protein [Prevotellaceae bacterium]
MGIRKTGLTIIACLFWATINSRLRNAEELMNLISSARNNDKCIIIKVFEDRNYETLYNIASLSSDFIETSIYASNPDDGFIIEKYGVKAFPSIVVLNPEGHLLLPAKKISSPAEIEDYAEVALSMKAELNPMAQMDMDYRNNAMDINRLFEYIGKRTDLGLDNSEMIDRYATVAPQKNLMNEKILFLFVERNRVNVPGKFCTFMQENKEQIKIILKLSDERFNHFIDKSIESSFLNVCKNRDEYALPQLVNIKTDFCTENRDIIYNEYLTRYFYETRQPLKLLNQANAFVSLITQHRQTHRKKTTPLYSVTEGNYASKMVKTAQYVVETLSHKAALNDALNWISIAEQMTHSNIAEIYETRAYILYKLGNRETAIQNIEQAYHLIDHRDTDEKKNLGTILVKMKRGEKVF